MKNVNPNQLSRLRESISVEDNLREILVVTQPGCKHCSELEDLLHKYCIPYTNASVSTSLGRSLALESKANATPILVLRSSEDKVTFYTTNTHSVKQMLAEARDFYHS